MTITDTCWIVRPGAGELPPATAIGGKGHNLARLASTEVEVPPWFAVSADAFRDLVPSAESLSSEGEADTWRSHVRDSLALPPGFTEQLRSAIREAGLEDSLLAVRSSAVSEDGAQHSFAGQFDSVLGVRPGEVEAAVRRVWASACNAHALAYGGAPAPMAVVVQAMVDAEAAGVAFGADPVSGRRDVVVVCAVRGLGEGLVSGEMDADTHRLELSPAGDAVVRSEVEAADKPFALRLLSGGGTERTAVPGALRGIPALDQGEAEHVARQVRRLGEAFGEPQDVEWAIARAPGGERRLYILQARPVTTLPAPSAGEEEEGELRVWDNSNIVESYSGITSPLTFSFARAVYEDVYRQFCAVVGVPDAWVERHRHVFANMLGLVRGRVYYNLLNWYRTLALLPGYALNRAFMERMMGVRQKLENPPEVEASGGKLGDGVRLARMVGRLVRLSAGLKRAVPAFHARVDAALAPLAKEDFTRWPADRLVALYRRLEEELLRNWQTPLVNDFFAMIWFGVLGRLVEKWLPGSPPTLVNDLLTHEGGIISAEPARRVATLAATAARTPAVRARFQSASEPERLMAELEADPECAEFVREVREYLDRFGDRCMNELKLETVTLSEDPSFLLQTVRGYLAGGITTAQAEGGDTVRREAEERVARSLGGLRGRVFRLVLAQTRARVRDRENLRFERTRVFGVVRRIFLGMGAHLHRAGMLDAARDVFWLRVEEVFAHVDGTSAQDGLRGLAALRREEWARHAAAPAPPDRFESHGPVGLGRWSVPQGAASAPEDGSTLRGTGCCPGVVRAPVRIVRDPRDASDLRGHILVAERTDPGWTLLFPTAEGLLVERGSLLSHSAIVAREVGLPCVVSIPSLLATLTDGEMVEMDGTTGVVRRLGVQGEAHD